MAQLILLSYYIFNSVTYTREMYQRWRCMSPPFYTNKIENNVCVCRVQTVWAWQRTLEELLAIKKEESLITPLLIDIVKASVWLIIIVDYILSSTSNFFSSCPQPGSPSRTAFRQPLSLHLHRHICGPLAIAVSFSFLPLIPQWNTRGFARLLIKLMKIKLCG